MAGPILNEDYIKALLSVPVERDSVHRIQDGAVQTLLDLYDRKVTREEFIQNAAPCVLLYGQAAKYWALCTLYEKVLTDTLEKDEMRAIMEGLRINICAQTAIVADIVDRLKECPRDGEPIN